MKVIIEFEDVGEALKALAAVNGTVALTTAEPTAAGKRTTPKLTVVKETAKEGTEKAAEPTVDKSPAETKAADKPAPAASQAVTRDDVAKAIVALNKKKGRVVAVGVLEKFRTDDMPKEKEDGSPNEVKLPMIPKERYPELLKLANEALAVE